MKAVTAKACLFGGVVFAAGIANAQEWDIQGYFFGGSYFSLAYSHAWDDFGYGDYGNAAFPYNTGVMPDTSDYSQPDQLYGSTSVSTHVTNNTAELNAGWGGGGLSGYGYGRGIIAFGFYLDEDTDLDLSWDVTNTDGHSWMWLIEDNGAPPGQRIDDYIDSWIWGTSPELGDASTGEHTLSLDGGSFYYLAMQYQAYFDENDAFGTKFYGDTFLRANLVPSPSAIAVLGLGGLIASRRRRQ